MITKQKFENFLERHNLTKEYFAEVADVSVKTLDEYIEGSLQNKKWRQRIARSIYIIKTNNLCMPVISGYYRLLSDLFPEKCKAKELEESYKLTYKDIFNQCYEDEFGE